MEIEPERMEIEEPQHLLSEELKWAIIFYKQPQLHNLPFLSNREIARIVGNLYNRPTLTHQQVKYIFDKYSERGSVENFWNQDGRPKVLSPEQVEELINHATRNRTDSVNKYKEELNFTASRQTMNNTLIENGLKAYAAPPKLLLSQDNTRARMTFAEDHLFWTLRDWKRIVFTDESSFSLVNTSGRVLVRRQANEELKEDTVQAYDNFSKKVVVWGAISYDYKGPLVRVEGKLDSAGYIRLFNYRLRKWFPGLYEGQQVFQQDNARPHTGEFARSWFEKYNIEVMDWPSQSPDLNIIEDVWNYMKYRLKGRVFGDQDELWEELKAIWDEMDQDRIKNLYESLPRRMEALRQAKGLYTKY